MRHYPRLQAAANLRRALRKRADVDLASEPLTTGHIDPMSDGWEFPAGEQNSNDSGAVEQAPMMRHEGVSVAPYQFFWNGLSVVIENPVGSIRQGTDKDGVHWEIKMKDHYGFIKNTEGEDGEGVDVFINPAAPEHFDNQSGQIWIVHQEVGGKYDEDKVMIGYKTQPEAEKAYKRNYAKGWKGLNGGVTQISDVDFLNKFIDEHWQPKTKYKKSAQKLSVDPKIIDEAYDAALRSSIGLAFVPDMIHYMLECSMSEEAAKRALMAAAQQGVIELQPESGLNRLSNNELNMCLDGPQGTKLSWARMLRRINGQINSLNDLANNVGESGAPGNSMGPHSTQDDAHNDQNTIEDPDLHIQGMWEVSSQVDAPYSDGEGPAAVNFEEPDDERKVVHAKVGVGKDPYRAGRIYNYTELLEQHRHEIDINKNLGKQRRDFLWLRTAMPLWQIIDESEYWYRKNLSKKWLQSDRNKTIALAEMFQKGATITPLIVSPPGEENGGVWEGYHRVRGAELLMLPTLPVMMKIDPADSVWQLRVADFAREPWVCIDFDGTIANTETHQDVHNDAKPIPGVVECLQKMLDAGWRVSVWSARQTTMGSDWEKQLEKWLDHHDVPYTDIYEGKKPPADAFVDNSAVRFNNDWSDVYDDVERLIEQHREAGLLGVGDNSADAYTNGDETRDDLAITRDPATEGLMDQTAKLALLLSAAKFQPAFMDHKTQRVHVSDEPFHNMYCLPNECMSDPDTVHSHIESGFVTESGQFLTREQVYDVVNGKPGGRLLSEHLRDDQVLNPGVTGTPPPQWTEEKLKRGQ